MLPPAAKFASRMQSLGLGENFTVIDRSDAEETLELAVPLLEEAAGGEVEGMIGDPEPLAAIQDAVNVRGFDEIILSTLPQRFSRWLKLDLPSKAAGLGLPVTTVTAQGRDRAGV